MIRMLTLRKADCIPRHHSFLAALSCCLLLRRRKLTLSRFCHFDFHGASTTTPVDPLGRTTPSGTVLGFLQAAQSGNYSIAAQYLQMSAARRQSEGEQIGQQAQRC